MTAKRILRRAQPLFLILACLFIALLLGSQWSELRAYSWQVNIGWLALSTLLLMLTWAVEVGIWRNLLHLVGGRLPYAAGVRIWFLSAIMRYIPGNIWQPLSMTLYCHRWGVRPEATVTSIVLYQVVILLAAAPLAAVYLGVSGNWGLLTNLLSSLTPIVVIVVMLPVFVFLARPGWLVGVVNWVLGRLRRPALEVNLTSRRLFTLLVVAVVDWLLWGATFAALTFALGDYSWADVAHLAPHLVAVYPIAYVIGFLSVVTPSGLGVREGASYVLLAPLLGGAAIAVAVLAMRLWTTLWEVLIAALSWLTQGEAPPESLSQKAADMLARAGAHQARPVAPTRSCGAS